jgi:lysophospholipid acyltransferase (LPLAT)-like uncharacterized protein
MPRTHKKIISTPWMGRLAYQLVITYRRLLRITIVNEEPWQAWQRSGGRVLLCTWHQQLYGVFAYFDAYRHLHPAVMISRSADGELVSWVAHWGGWRPVRGSSSRGGMAALKTMIRHMRTYRMGMHILDGPKGPRGVVKPGVIQLARAADAVLVPFYLTTDRAWVFNSWDRFFLPKPGARVTVRFGNPLQLKPVKDKADREAERRRLQALMAPGLVY